MHEEPHPLAGKKVKIGPGNHACRDGIITEGREFHIEDWADRVLGKDVSEAAPESYAAMEFCLRSAFVDALKDMPSFGPEMSVEAHTELHFGRTVYGRVGRGKTGRIVHVWELDFEDVER